MQAVHCSQATFATRKHGNAPAATRFCRRLAVGGPLRWQPQRQQRSASVVVASQPESKTDAEVQTEKWGLEAGLWKVWSTKGANGQTKGQEAKALLARYGSAYLITSISFAIVSMTACYLAVDAGLDVASLLAKIGLKATNTNETVGTFAIAYAAHKALSPVRFPPTVALTPVVARWLGKDKGPAAGSADSGSADPGSSGNSK
ncbi:hypothetical protein D9Q98_002768 [Chlorella vulgaris]|uniref:DUF1279 domain-containing protein n=1 Tax=Chlorella vulgaris TaxID=3077 RepID=A0A9D4YZ60_CHLVU|nr:hypothetical protein D9Q98_002768 [Chlorella vulgaris]